MRSPPARDARGEGGRLRTVISDGRYDFGATSRSSLLLPARGERTMRLAAIALLFVTLMGGCAAEELGDLEAVDTTPSEPVAAQEEAVEGFPTCGGNICGPRTYCCNASCGWCVPKGALCLQVVCETATAGREPPDGDQVDTSTAE